VPTEVRPLKHPEGVPLVDYVQGRVGRRPAQRVLAFLQEWDTLADELGRDPSLEEYAERWRLPRATAYSDQRLFREAFPGEQNPRRLLNQLWELRRDSYGALLSAKVVATGSRLGSPVIRSGQEWQTPGGDVVVIEAIDGNTVHGALRHRESAGVLSAWVGSLDDFGSFTLLGAEENALWHVAFDVVGEPTALGAALGRAGFTVDRYAKPADPAPDRRPYAGTIWARVSAADKGEARDKLVRAVPDQSHLQTDPAAVRICESG
jgi:hypothetical protein